MLELASLVVLCLGVLLLRRPGEPPLLLYIFGFQWLSISAAIFYTDLQGVSIADFYNGIAKAEDAVWLSLGGLLALSIGFRLGAQSVRLIDASLFRKTVAQRPLADWFWFYVVTAIACSVADALAYVVPGLSQPMLAAANLKWAPFLMLAFAALSGHERKTYFYIAFAVELVQGVGGFFSDFKTVFIFTLLAAVAAGARPTVRQVIGIGALGAVTVAFALAWTAVKPDYRQFVSQGANSQTVEVGYSERIGKLGELLGELNAEKLQDASDNLVRRIADVQFFGAVLDYVPRITPFENGAIWWDAIERPFLPRIIFSDKTVIDDSERTRKYTGMDVSGAESATSISIGYMSEAYIDFGEFGVGAVLLAYGLFIGFCHRKLVQGRFTRGLLGASLSASVFFQVSSYDASITKIFGGLVIALLVARLAARYLVSRWYPWAIIEPGR